MFAVESKDLCQNGPEPAKGANQKVRGMPNLVQAEAKQRPSRGQAAAKQQPSADPTEGSGPRSSVPRSIRCFASGAHVAPARPSSDRTAQTQRRASGAGFGAKVFENLGVHTAYKPYIYIYLYLYIYIYKYIQYVGFYIFDVIWAWWLFSSEKRVPSERKHANVYF